MFTGKVEQKERGEGEERINAACKSQSLFLLYRNSLAME
jgi:hypothetical protein